MSGHQRLFCRLIFLLGFLALAGCEVPNLTPDESDEPDPGIYRGQPIKQWIIEQKDEGTRDRAKATLDMVGPDDKDLVPALTALLKDDDPVVRSGACKLLGQIGPNAKEALQDLEETFLDADIIVSRDAMKAYRRVMPLR